MKHYLCAVVQAMPGTDDYGWYVVVSDETHENWTNFSGNRPLANVQQVSRAVANLVKYGIMPDETYFTFLRNHSVDTEVFKQV